MSDNIVVSSLNMELMDCPICCEPLTTPIIQCENGHATCNSCSEKTQKCHSCTLPIRRMRNRILEDVADSLRVCCSFKNYGCPATVRYPEKINHEKFCSFIECSCPIEVCNVKGTSEMIYAHCKVMHKDFMKPFVFGRQFPVSVRLNDNFFILQEENTDIVFVLNNTTCSYGNILTICCLGPLAAGCCPYEIEVNANSSHKFHSTTQNIQGTGNYYRSFSGFLLDSDHEFFADGLIKMEFCVYRAPELA
ncbi:E3 ubiquitin-protein ligase SINA-like 10 [Mercurialis annua]|uniref:E3 ubiquitin-protein ligase SINA-like 10 n=1 Tax=Mercurialis annua TaxID=3986 RepID=UPI00215F1D23|nr:E3 ubiquitin-protein ligase SINA-like 10 [Mercurialis annua]